MRPRTEWYRITILCIELTVHAQYPHYWGAEAGQIVFCAYIPTIQCTPMVKCNQNLRVGENLTSFEQARIVVMSIYFCFWPQLMRRSQLLSSTIGRLVDNPSLSFHEISWFGWRRGRFLILVSCTLVLFVIIGARPLSLLWTLSVQGFIGSQCAIAI